MIKETTPTIIPEKKASARKKQSRQVNPMAATKNIEKEIREPFIHITKRDEMPWWQSWLVRITAVLLALIVSGAVTIMLTGQNPLEVYATMFKGAFGTTRRIWQLMQNVALLLCISLAVTPAFKMRFWNIGAEGQVLIGGLAAAAVWLHSEASFQFGCL